MMIRSLFSAPRVLLWCLAGTQVCAAPASSSDTATPARATADPSSTACGDIVNSGRIYFKASDIYECLISVPFNAAVATGFIDYYIDTIQFQSTLAYLKNPPSSYQRHPVDLVAGLNKIKQSITTGAFANQYEFEAALQRLIYSAHDTHLDLTAGILGAFSFGAPVAIVSVSLDGTQLPKIYFSDDISDSQNDGTWQPSAISKINGQNSMDYLQQYAADNAVGGLESHADFNQLVASPALDIQGYFPIWTGAGTFYPGDTLTFVFENGTSVGPMPWIGVYNSPGETGPLETGGDFYNFFVLGYYPASYVPWTNDEPTDDSTDPSAATSTFPAATSTSMASPTPSSWNHSAYPSAPDVVQPDLGIFGTGSLSGYFLNSSSIAVLSIPSFYMNPEAVDDFSNTVAQFLSSSKAAGMKKVVIDLQQNGGGDSLLAWDTFKQFFPTIDPYGGSRLRAHAAANSMGSTITGYFDELDEEYYDFYGLYANEWVSSTRINVTTNRNFTSWAEFFGPHPANGDIFTSVQRYDLNNILFDTLSVGSPNNSFSVYGSAGRPANATQPYAANDIIILSDGLCSSTCALFMEMMHHEAGVRTVVAGGLPVYGPMQAPGLTRGARSYGMDILDANIDYAEALLEWEKDPNPFFLPNRTEALDVFVLAGSINLRDQVRKGEDIPLQFVYEAADCRIFYTPRTVFNYTALWQYAADAIWTNPSLCIKDSTGFSSINTTKTAIPTASAPPSETPSPAPAKLGSIIMSMISSPSANQKPILDSKFQVRSTSRDGQPCPTNGECGKGFFCFQTFTTCASGKPTLVPTCVPRCSVNQERCSNNAYCQPLQKEESDLQSSFVVVSGFCRPPRSVCAPSTNSKVKSGMPAPPH
ncbi:Uncharacterized protein BP5553_08749 [Venustampulla echinocandica]|uniref:CPAF-like PDZ domain-containing protein n=1 Tax=Venustampulla echinocandica TaxID=2656787 RepID=A0A370TF73_9HELO|nr:Uncharacterized protein BP5553_08749 [Venustampulla echinocandica]RDL33310.1 Uncharacterized protein BP5553_08749 [Venustampulla echinocandica]